MLSGRHLLSGVGVLGLLLGASACGGAPTPTAASARPHQSASVTGTALKSSAQGSSVISHANSTPPPTKKSSNTASPPVATAMAPLVQPSPAKPLTALVIGDSLGEDLQYGMADVAGTGGSLRIIEAAYGSSGLVNQQYYDWPKVLASDLRRYHPQLVYVLFGGNDARSFDQGARYIPFGSALWKKVYGARVNTIISEVLRAKAHLIWVGLPVMSPSSVLSNTRIKALNAIYRAEVQKHPAQASFIATWSLFRTPRGGFAEYMVDSAGVRVMVRDPDGVHIAPPAGQELIASYVLRQTEKAERISLCVRGSNLWQQYSLPHCAAKR